MTAPQHLIAARRAHADNARRRADQALKAMVRAREPITFAAVAARAQVSREYLYRVPDLTARIRAAREQPQPQRLNTATTASEQQPIISALRGHIRRLEATHAEELRALREENEQLRRQLETTLGQLLAT